MVFAVQVQPTDGNTSQLQKLLLDSGLHGVNGAPKVHMILFAPKDPKGKSRTAYNLGISDQLKQLTPQLRVIRQARQFQMLLNRAYNFDDASFPLQILKLNATVSEIGGALDVLLLKRMLNSKLFINWQITEEAISECDAIIDVCTHPHLVSSIRFNTDSSGVCHSTGDAISALDKHLSELKLAAPYAKEMVSNWIKIAFSFPDAMAATPSQRYLLAKFLSGDTLSVDEFRQIGGLIRKMRHHAFNSLVPKFGLTQELLMTLDHFVRPIEDGNFSASAVSAYTTYVRNLFKVFILASADDTRSISWSQCDLSRIIYQKSCSALKAPDAKAKYPLQFVYDSTWSYRLECEEKRQRMTLTGCVQAVKLHFEQTMRQLQTQPSSQSVWSKKDAAYWGGAQLLLPVFIAFELNDSELDDPERVMIMCTRDAEIYTELAVLMAQRCLSDSVVSTYGPRVHGIIVTEPLIRGAECDFLQDSGNFTSPLLIHTFKDGKTGLTFLHYHLARFTDNELAAFLDQCTNIPSAFLNSESKAYAAPMSIMVQQRAKTSIAIVMAKYAMRIYRETKDIKKTAELVTEFLTSGIGLYDDARATSLAGPNATREELDREAIPRSTFYFAKTYGWWPQLLDELSTPTEVGTPPSEVFFDTLVEHIRICLEQ